MLKQNQQPFILEITVLSAEGLNTNCSSTLFSRRIRPFITFTTVPPSPYNHHMMTMSSSSKGDKKCHVYRTRVDDEGGTNPKWGDKFDVPLDHTFFANRYSTIHLQLYTKRLIVGRPNWVGVRFRFTISGPLRLGLFATSVTGYGLETVLGALQLLTLLSSYKVLSRFPALIQTRVTRLLVYQSRCSHVLQLSAVVYRWRFSCKNLTKIKCLQRHRMFLC